MSEKDCIYIGLYNTAPTLGQNVGTSRVIGEPIKVQTKPPYQLLFEFLAYVYQELQKGRAMRFKLQSIRKELHISSERDLLKSGIEIKSGVRWSWYSDDSSVFVSGRYYWLFADLTYTDIPSQDHDMQEVHSTRLPTYDQIIKPSLDYASRMLCTILQQLSLTQLLFSHFSQPVVSLTPFTPRAIMVREPSLEDRQRHMRLQVESVRQKQEIKRLERKVERYKLRGRDDDDQEEEEQKMVKQFTKLNIGKQQLSVRSKGINKK